MYQKGYEYVEHSKIRWAWVYNVDSKDIVFLGYTTLQVLLSNIHFSKVFFFFIHFHEHFLVQVHKRCWSWAFLTSIKIIKQGDGKQACMEQLLVTLHIFFYCPSFPFRVLSFTSLLHHPSFQLVIHSAPTEVAHLNGIIILATTSEFLWASFSLKLKWKAPNNKKILEPNNLQRIVIYNLTLLGESDKLQDS